MLDCIISDRAYRALRTYLRRDSINGASYIIGKGWQVWLTEETLQRLYAQALEEETLSDLIIRLMEHKSAPERKEVQ